MLCRTPARKYPRHGFAALAAATAFIALSSTSTAQARPLTLQPIAVFPRTPRTPPGWLAATARLQPAPDTRTDVSTKTSWALEDQGCSASPCTNDTMSLALSRLVADQTVAGSHHRAVPARVTLGGTSFTWPLYVTQASSIGRTNQGRYGSALTFTVRF